MRRGLAATIIVVISVLGALAEDFDRRFDELTLRIDVSICQPSDRDRNPITVDTIVAISGWYGRRVNLTCDYLDEWLKVTVIDSATADTIYVTSYSPQVPEDPTAPTRTTVSVPKPKSACSIVVDSCTISLTDTDLARLTGTSDRPATPFITLRQAADPKRCINLAIVAEGYTGAEMGQFLDKAVLLDSMLFEQQAFKSHVTDFNVVAVMLESPQSGVTVPSDSIWVQSALGSHYDSYGLDRLLTIDDTRLLWDALAGVPAAHILVLANSEKYGGSGSYGEYAIASARSPQFVDIITHEFGHSFGWLGDEYEDGYSVTYTPDVEPKEPNITTLHDFSGKWENLISTGEATLIEGAGYQSKGVWRGCEHCLMRALGDRTFCAVCNQAISRIINYYTEE